MSRWWWLATVVLIGTAMGGLAAGALVTPPLEPLPTASPEPPSPPAQVVVPTQASDRVLLVWLHGGVPLELAQRVATIPGVTDATVVRGDRADLTRTADAAGVIDEWGQGWAVPLDVLAIDPASFAALAPVSAQPAIRGLAANEALLGSTSAALRRTDAGAVLELASGTHLTVTAVLDDVVVAGAEVVVDVATGERIGVTTPRYLLLRYTGDRSSIEAAVRDAAPGRAVRVRGHGEAPFLRHGDAVLPQALIKARFGEFSYRPPSAGRDFSIDPGWAADNIVTEDVPLLGRVRCHRGIVAPLRHALAELEAAGLGHVVDRDGYAGCYNPRLVAPDGGVSRHAWGVAIDLNADANPLGATSTQDPRLVETMARWGFAWGGFWLVPHAMHFEYLEAAPIGD